MSLSADQCVEVAKMWGWKRKLFNGVPMWMGDPTKGSWVAEEYLPEMVNSWSGFGRTVEAMIARGGHPHDIIKKSCPTSERVIELTHLAALEAVREEEQRGKSK